MPGKVVGLALTEQIQSSALTSSDESKKYHPETRQLKRNF